jgi:hypothetical protein
VAVTLSYYYFNGLCANATPSSTHAQAPTHTHTLKGAHEARASTEPPPKQYSIEQDEQKKLTAKLKPIRKNTPRSADLPTAAALAAEDTHTHLVNGFRQMKMFIRILFFNVVRPIIYLISMKLSFEPHIPPKKRQPFSTVSMYVDI